MNDILKRKLHECSKRLAEENDAHLKLSKLYELALEEAQNFISTANQTSSVDEKINLLANGIQSIMDLILDHRNKAKATKIELQTKISVIDEIIMETNNASPAEIPEKKSQNKD